METSSTIVPYLFAVTFLLAIVLGVWQYAKAGKARREHHRSADAAAHGDNPSVPPSAR
jgi:cytochrome oxidase assembly protein ShyY1